MTYQDRPKDTPGSDLSTRAEGAPTSSSGEPAIRQLDSIIENLANYATPVLKEIAARAAELAAKAGEAAGPMAQRARRQDRIRRRAAGDEGSRGCLGPAA